MLHQRTKLSDHVNSFRKNFLRRPQNLAELKKNLATTTTTTPVPTTTEFLTTISHTNTSKIIVRKFRPRMTTLSPKSVNVTVTTPKINRFRFQTRKLPYLRTTTTSTTTTTTTTTTEEPSTEYEKDQTIESSNQKTLTQNDFNTDDILEDVVLAIRKIQAAPIRGETSTSRKNVEKTRGNSRYLARGSIKQTQPSTSYRTDRYKYVSTTPVYVEYEDDEESSRTIELLGQDIVKGKVLIHPSGKIQCLDQGNFPHPISCRKFISCAKMENGAVIGWEYTCPKNLSFDPIGGICNWAAGLGCTDV